MVLQKAFQLVKTGAGALVGGGGGPLVLVKTDVHVNICNSGMISMVTLICFSMVMMNANLKSNLDMMFMMNMNVDLASPYPWLFLTVLVIAWLVYKISSDHGDQNGFKILAILVIAGLIYKIYCDQQAQNGFQNLTIPYPWLFFLTAYAGLVFKLCSDKSAETGDKLTIEIYLLSLVFFPAIPLIWVLVRFNVSKTVCWIVLILE